MPSTYLTRTPSSAGNRKTYTFSLWFKRAKLSEQVIFNSTGGGIGEIRLNLVNDNLKFVDVQSGSTNISYITNRKFRDTSGWYHLVLAVDTTAAGGNRIKIYINGEQETSFSSSTEPNQNYDTTWNTANVFQIASNQNPGDYFDGSISHFHFIDGTAYAASTFGSTDSTTGEWKINTSPSVTYGTNGFFWLKDSIATTDHSPNSNTFTVAGGTLTKTEDSPSNVFATGNPLHRGDNLSDATFSNGNTSHEGTVSGGSYPYTFSTLAASSGKWYAEFKRVHGETMMGIGRGKAATYLGSDTYEYAYFSTGILYGNDSDLGSYGSALNNNDIVGVAMDLDNNAVYWSINGVWQNSGVPTSGASKTGAQSITAASSNGYGVYHFAYGKGGSGVSDIEANFGNGYFGTTAVSSAGTNASGIGIFEYDVPTGYTALSTKGLNL